MGNKISGLLNGIIKHEKFMLGVVITVLVFVSLFLFFDIILNTDIFGFKFICYGFKDYLADFVNHSRHSYMYKDIYGLYVSESALPPLQYLLFSTMNKTAEFFAFPTLYYEGYAIEPHLARVIFVANLFMTVTSIFFYILVYNNIKINNTFVKCVILFSLIMACPYLYLLERGNCIILSVFAISYFLFYYKSENKFLRESSIFLLAFAGALKLFPVLFSVILLQEQRFEDFKKWLLYFLVMFFGAFLLFHGGLDNIYSFLYCLSLNGDTYKRFSFFNMTLILFVLMFCTMFLRSAKKTAMAVVFLILSMNTFEGYRYMYLYPVIIMFLNDYKNKYDLMYVPLLVLVISPITQLYLHSEAVILVVGGVLLIDIFVNKIALRFFPRLMKK